MTNETTTAQAEASNESEQHEQQGQEQALEAQALAEPSSIPEKFVGKSALEIGKSYVELEKSFHKISSERAEERRQADESKQKLQDLEARMQALTAERSQAPREQVEETDPLAEYDEEFDSNPKEAIKKVVKKVQEKALTVAQRATLEAEARSASDYYFQQKKDNPDFARLEPKMQALANEFGDLIRSDKINSVKALKILHLAARGSDVDSYVGDAVSRAKKEGISIRQEKQKAFSEGTSSEGSVKSVAFKELSLKDMEKALGRSDD